MAPGQGRGSGHDTHLKSVSELADEELSGRFPESSSGELSLLYNALILPCCTSAALDGLNPTSPTRFQLQRAR
ncbi:hypothetical protein V5799_008676 [Amblyomma americanum]|uniref:Uncharacterized protein n=1 Tax=Amblyomma americanum TaxID=6943 RepID=A0AAQ4FDZ8_AMBAM